MQNELDVLDREIMKLYKKGYSPKLISNILSLNYNTVLRTTKRLTGKAVNRTEKCSEGIIQEKVDNISSLNFLKTKYRHIENGVKVNYKDEIYIFIRMYEHFILIERRSLDDTSIIKKTISFRDMLTDESEIVEVI